LCAHGSRCPPLVSGRRRRCALAVHIGRLYRSRHRAGRSFKSRHARCAFMVLDALLWRRTAAVAELSPSRHRAGRLLFKSRRARYALSWCSVPLWRRAAAVVVLSPSTLDVYTALAIVQGGIVQVETRALRSRCSMPFFGVGPPPSLCALAVHIGRLYRSRHRAGQSFKSRRARCALMVLDALLWRRTAAVAELSPSRHRAGRLLFKSRRACYALSWCSVPSLASGRRRRCALAVHIGRLYRSRHRAGRLFKSRRAHCALTVLNALLWRRTAAVIVLSPST
jgi:hypothetical protein